MKKKVIILYSTGGMGHKKAAIAISKAFEERAGECEVKSIDAVSYGSRIYKFIHLNLYVYFMGRGKMLWALLYFLTNLKFVDRCLRGLREKIYFSDLRLLVDLLIKERPDAIIETQYTLSNIAGALKRIKDFDSRLYMIVTDYGPHLLWFSDHIDTFFVGAESIVPYFLQKGMAKDKIVVTGMPVVEEFTREFDIDNLKNVYGLDKSRKTIFILSGGFGVGPIESILLSLNSCRLDIQAIVVCGHNKKAYDNIDKLKKRLSYPVILFGFTDKVAELMAVSDLMITKAGGISVTEALNMRLPMILFASIPGQEMWNEKLLLEAGAAEKAGSVKEIPDLVNRILLSPDVYEALKSGIDKLRRPRAAQDIVDTVLKEI